MKIGFIGLGIMGKPMAKNLLKAGYTDLLVNNRSQAPVQELEAAGAKGATQQEIGEQCDVVITMLPNSPQVKEVMLGANGVASHMKPGAVFIDCSSINGCFQGDLCRAAEEGRGDAGCSRLWRRAQGNRRNLSFMVGGKQEIFDTYKPVLDAMGASTVRCGEVGAGNTTKLANQIIVACNIQALAEALTLAQKAGVDPELVFQAIKGGLAGSTVMNAKAPHDDRRQRQARLQDRPAHQGPEQRSGLRTRCGRSRAHDCRGAGDHAVAPQPRGRSEGPQRHCPVLRVPDRHPDRSLRIKEHR